MILKQVRDKLYLVLFKLKEIKSLHQFIFYFRGILSGKIVFKTAILSKPNK